MALDLADGHEHWKFTAPAGFPASAAMRDGRLYIGDSAGTFYCLDAANGNSLWTYKTGGEIDSSANFYKDMVLFGSQDFTLYCLRADRGTLVWKHETQDEIHCCPTVVEDRAFVAGCDSQLHVIDLHDGHEVAAIDMESPTGSTPAVRGDALYVGTEAGTFFAIDWKKATVRWKWHNGWHADEIRSSAAIPAEAVIFGSRDKRVRALDPANGKVLWTFAAPRANRRLAGGRRPARVYCRHFGRAGLRFGSPRTGKKQWEYEAGGEFDGSPAVAAGRLVIASEAGVVYCFGEK